jgi:hypothetical protein
MAVPLAAHEGHSHGKPHKMAGTVSAVHVDANHVEIEGTDGKKHAFYVDAKTRYTRGTTKLTLADLTSGTRVIVEGRKEGEKVLAEVVKLGPGRPQTKP